jgi:competence protein ComEC
VDGGPGNRVIEELNEVMPFFDKSIDMIVMTHPHADHVDGLVEVLGRYDVGMVLATGVKGGDKGAAEFWKEVREQGVGVEVARAGRDFSIGSVFMDVLYPIEELVGEEVENLNNSSIAMMVEYEDVRVLLTGDLEEEGEEEILRAGGNLEADIYKAGHHGSKTASSLAFMERVRPEIVAIQCGKDNKFEHPHPEALRNFHRVDVREIRRTDEEGRIEFIF